MKNRQPNGCLSRGCFGALPVKRVFWRLQTAVLGDWNSQHRLASKKPGWKNMNRTIKPAILLAASFLSCGGALAQSQVIGAPPEASNMKLVGYNDLQARSAYQPTIHHQG